jgi:3-deoxy-D-manno-octulosonic-acid transferase
VAFVGGSLDGRRGGQNMMEPAGYGAALVFGPHVWNFRDTAAKLVEAGAAVQISDAVALELILEQRLLHDPQERRRLGTAAQSFVRSQQGATERTLDCLDQLLKSAVEPGCCWSAPHGPQAMGLGKNGDVRRSVGTH